MTETKVSGLEVFPKEGLAHQYDQRRLRSKNISLGQGGDEKGGKSWQ